MIFIPHIIVYDVLFVLLLQGMLFLILSYEGHPGFEAFNVGKCESRDDVFFNLPYLLDLHPFELLLASSILILSAVAVSQLIPFFFYLVPFVLKSL